MNEELKEALGYAVNVIGTTIGVTLAGYITLRVAQKVYGPIEIHHN